MPAPDLSNDPVPQVTRLTNRAAALAFAAAFAIVVALVALPGVLREGEPVRRLAALAAVILAVGMTTWARRVRAELHAARARLAGSPGPSVAAAPVSSAARGRRAHPRHA